MEYTKRIMRALVTGAATLGAVPGVTLTGGVVAGGALTLASATPAMACSDESYVGSICAFAFDFCPRGYLPADGRTLAMRDYQALFSLIGYRYGGNGADTFKIPDLRGRALIGMGAGPNLDPVALGQSLGAQKTTLAIQNMPIHTHTATFTGTGGGTQPVSIPADPGTLGVSATLIAKPVAGLPEVKPGVFLGQGGSGGMGASIYVPETVTSPGAPLGGLAVHLTGTPGHGAINFNVPIGITGGTVAIAPIGGGQPFPTQSPAIGMNYCIAALGLYPIRP